jgi:hypothetical protein
MSPRYIRRKADIALLKASRRAKCDKELPPDTRRAARVIFRVFYARVLFRWHSKPSEKLRVKIHGHYCGPGYGAPAGERRMPTDYLDAACREHDMAYGVS